MRRINITGYREGFDTVAFDTLVDGVPRTISITKAELAALPNAGARMRRIGELARDFDDERRSGSFASLIGTIDIPDRVPGTPGQGGVQGPTGTV